MDNITLLKNWEKYKLNNGTGLTTSYNYIIHPRIETFFNKLTINLNQANNKGLHWDVIDTFHNWINNSTNNKIDIAVFDRKHLIHKPYDCLHEASWRYRHRRLRKLRGEHQYLDNSFFYLHFDELKPVNVEHKPFFRYVDSPTGKFFDLDEEDWVYISIPFFGEGEVSDKTEGLLNQADLLGVPVVVDCTLLPLAKGFDINLNRPSVKEVIFTIGSNIGMYKSQLGIRFSKYSDKDNAGADGSDGVPPIQLLNGVDEGFVSFADLLVANDVLKAFSADFLYNSCREIQLEICQELDLIPTSCVNICMIPEHNMWVSDKKANELYNEYVDAGNDLFPRVDISWAITQKLKKRNNE
tara:strand:+ start:56 stop:1117 length:1062 start_codon:yes stop_codon:yes gene_type:complete